MSSPLVSIILPTYNGEQYLSTSLDSCLNQTYQNIEVIIVDDASSDSTPQIIKEYLGKDTRVHLIRHEKNLRLPAALNTGFAAAKGTIFSWTSDDNIYQPNAVAEMVLTLESDPDASFVYADFDVINENGEILERYQVTPPMDLIIGEHKIACFAYRREIVETLGGYQTDLFLAEDYDYWLRIFSAQYKMVPIHKSLYQYRRHAKSLTDIYQGKAFASAELSLVYHLSKMTWLSKTDRGKAYLHLASLAMWQKKIYQSINYTIKSVLLVPSLSFQKSIHYLMKQIK